MRANALSAGFPHLKGLAFGACFGALALALGSAFAQEETPLATVPVQALPEAAAPASEEKQPTQLDAVKVTGSRIKRADVETQTPVITLTKKDLDRTGLTSVGDILQTLPSAGSAFNTTINNGGTGATEVDLRNLGSNRVLVLVDGHRWVSGLRALSTNSVDLNTIPFEIVERIEVLLDGASAVYGSDAITGVVNIITKKDFEGVAIKGQYGRFTKGDGANALASFSAGRGFDFTSLGRTTVFGNVSIQDQADIFAGDRRLSREPLFGTGLTRASTFIPDGRMLFVSDPSTIRGPTDIRTNASACPSLAGDVAQGQLDDNEVPLTLPPGLAMLPGNLNLCDVTHIRGANQGVSDYRAFADPDDRFNFAPDNYLSTPLQTRNAFFSLSQGLGEFATFSAQYLYSERRSKQQLAAQPICIGELCPVIGGFIPSTLLPDADGNVSPLSFNQAAYVTANNPGNPFGQVIGCTGTARAVNPCTDNMNPSNNSNVAAALFGTGAILRRMQEGDPRIQEQRVPTRFFRVGLDGEFDGRGLPVGWEIGYSRGVSEQDQTLLNNYDMSRVLQGTSLGCATTPGCVVLDFMGSPGSFTREMLDFVQINEFSNTRQEQTDFYVNVNTTVPLKGLLAAPLGVAFGYEARSSRFTDTPSVAAANSTTSGLTSQFTDGEVSSKEYFVELQMPLAKNAPLAYDLTLTAAGRIANYSGQELTENGKLGLAYRPIKSVLLRTTYSTSFRAPDVGNLFLGNAGSFPALADPCVEREAGTNAEANCTADGIPADVTQVSFQILSPFTGNRNLKPETSRSITAGVVLSPQSVQGLDFSVDYYRIRLDNFITAPGGQAILNNCYTLAAGARRDCELIQRTSNGTLLLVTNGFQNFPFITTAGFDYQLGYVLPTKAFEALKSAGRFKLQATATFLSSFNIFSPGPDGVTLRRDDSPGATAGTLANLSNLTRWKINPSLQWNKGAMTASWNTRIVWGARESCEDFITPSLTSLGFCSDPDNRTQDGEPAPQRRVKMGVKHDVQATYAHKPAQVLMTLGVQNVLNNDPPLCLSCTNSFDPSYWIPGVAPYLSVKKDF